MGLLTIYNRMNKSFTKMPVWFHLLVLLAIIFILVNIYNQVKPTQEGFINQQDKFVVKKGINLYDDFYVNIYDDLFFKDIINKCEVGSIQNITKPTPSSNILVIGSGTGHIANELHNEELQVIGIDESPVMVKYAKNKYPSIKFKVANPLNAMIFNSETFTHITCLNLNIYKYKNRTELIQNIYNWLQPGGYFIVHLVDKNKFDPVVPAAKPFVLINPQSVAKNRINSSEVIFNNFKYKSNFQIFPNDFVQFREIFKDTSNGSGKVRENIHNMWIPSKQKVISECKEAGFIAHIEVDLMVAQMEYQYLYIFQKPE